MAGKGECNNWLMEILKDKELHLCNNVKAEATKNGFCKAELRQAKKDIGVKTYHQFDEDGATENWFWYLED